MEVGLLHAAVLKRELAGQYGRQAVHEAGLELRFHHIRIDHASRINRDNHAMRSNIAITAPARSKASSRFFKAVPAALVARFHLPQVTLNGSTLTGGCF
jgi:hypothetical protein